MFVGLGLPASFHFRYRSGSTSYLIMCLCFPQKFPAYEIIGLIGSSRSDKDAGVYDALHRRISERISTALFSPFQAQLTFRASSSIRASQSIAGFGTIFPGLSDTSRAAGPPSGPVNVMDSPKDNPLSSFSKLHAALFMGMASDIILFLYPIIHAFPFNSFDYHFIKYAIASTYIDCEDVRISPGVPWSSMSILLFLRIWRDQKALPGHDPGGPEKRGKRFQAVSVFSLLFSAFLWLGFRWP